MSENQINQKNYPRLEIASLQSLKEITDGIMIIDKRDVL